MVDYGPGPITHHEDCWRSRSHWRCAVARVERLESQLFAIVEARDDALRKCNRYANHTGAWEEKRKLFQKWKAAANRLDRAIDAADHGFVLEEARAEGAADALDQAAYRVDEAEASPLASWDEGAYAAWVNYCQRLDARIKRELEKARNEERERCLKAMCRYCREEIPAVRCRSGWANWLHRKETSGGILTMPCRAGAIREADND